MQYARDWRALVARLCAASRNAVFVTRSPFVNRSPAFVTVQRAYATAYPGWVFNYREFVRAVEDCRMRLDEVFVNGRGPPAQGAPESSMHLGLLFTRTPPAALRRENET